MMSPVQNLLAIGAVAATVFAAPAPAEVDRSACEPLPHGSGLIPRPDTAEAFKSFAPFARAATSASTPIGYVQTYSNLLTTFDEPSQFVRYKNLDSYDVQECATECNNEANCNAFAIFFERSPLLKPGKGCENPSSSTLIKCTMWSGTILPDVAVNKGQLRNRFSVVMAGSNAYVKDIAFGRDKNISAVVPKGWVTQKYSNGAAISAPLDCHGVDTYMGMSYWRDGRFNAQRCIDACEAAGKTDLQSRKCNFVNTYVQRKNGVPISQHCAMFSQYWPALFATNKGQQRGPITVEISETDSYSIRRSDVEYTACYNLSTTPSSVSLLPSAISIPPVIVPSRVLSLPANPSSSQVTSLAPAPPSYQPTSLLTISTSSQTLSLPATPPSSQILSLPNPIAPPQIPSLGITPLFPPIILPRATQASALTFTTLAARSDTSFSAPWAWETVIAPTPSSFELVFPAPVPSTETATGNAPSTPTPTTTQVQSGDMIAVFEVAPSSYSTVMIIPGTESAAPRRTVKIDPFLPPKPYTFPPMLSPRPKPSITYVGA